LKKLKEPFYNKMAKMARKLGYLCAICATEMGGVWPEGHRATAHGNTCPFCNKNTMLCSWDDWDWPHSTIDHIARKTREV
jgi:hypothetical protein